MTEKVINICTLVMNSLEKHSSELPMRLTFMIRLLIDEEKDQIDFRALEPRQAHMIADFLVGSWLSNAFRYPECHGLKPAFKEEALTFGHVMMSCRLVMETMLCC